jgi:hypothetical protein
MGIPAFLSVFCTREKGTIQVDPGSPNGFIGGGNPQMCSETDVTGIFSLYAEMVENVLGKVTGHPK